ncbi:MAG: recombinase family protein, partial [Oscillospiraceae bacterium]|nr:recombinase family protein [Oscillospiraceae bacterium]
DIEIVGVYTDNGITGQHFERREFQRMLADAEAGKIDCIVVKDLSRLGRNAIDSGYYIEKYFPLHHIRFIAVNDQYDSEDAENSGNHIIVPLKNIINEAYAADISRKVRSQAHQAMQDGEFIGARPPFGYKKDPDNCHKLLVNEDTAPVVRQIFAWAADGVALNVIVKKLNEAGIVTPGYYLASVGIITNKKLMGSGKWQTWTVAKILADEVYTGDMVQGKSVSVRHRQTPTKPEDWIVVRGTHEPLISRELFDQVQAIRQRVAAKYTQTPKVPYTENILRGRVFCGCCGKNLHRQKSHNGYIYHCISNQRIGKGACENNIGYLQETELFDTILSYVQSEALIVMGKSLQLKQQDKRITAQKEQTEREIAALQREAEKARSYLAGLYEHFITGVLTQAEYHGMKAEYHQKVMDCVERISALQEGQDKLEKQAARYLSLADRLKAVKKSADLTAAFVSQVIESVTVNSPDDISVSFSFRDDFDGLMEVLNRD